MGPSRGKGSEQFFAFWQKIENMEVQRRTGSSLGRVWLRFQIRRDDGIGAQELKQNFCDRILEKDQLNGQTLI